MGQKMMLDALFKWKKSTIWRGSATKMTKSVFPITYNKDLAFFCLKARIVCFLAGQLLGFKREEGRGGQRGRGPRREKELGIERQ